MTTIGSDRGGSSAGLVRSYLGQVGGSPSFRACAVAGVVGIVILWLVDALAAGPLGATLAAALVAAVLARGARPETIAAPTVAPIPQPEPETVSDEPFTEPVLPPPPKPDTSWRIAVSAMPDPALALDAEGMVVHHNAAVADLFPRIRVGQQISSVSRSPELLAAIEKARDAQDVTIVELHDRVPVERRVAAILTAFSFRDAAEGDPVLLVTFRDITDQEKLAQMRADFIAHASHELRTPLASLRGFVETLQGPARDDAVARERFLGIMAAQAERMTRLIDDLLSLSRIEMRVHLPPRGTVALGEVIDFVAQSLEPVARAAGITVTLERLLPSARVRGDREELVQVFQNLIQNAIRYGKQGGTVNVRIAPAPGGQAAPARVSVSVTDDGHGIAPEHLPRLTERFYRISASASREKGGTGLGLAIVKHIVTRHRGELKIASTVGVGSTFTVVLDELPGSGSLVSAPATARK